MSDKEESLFEGSLSMIVKINAPSREEAIEKLHKFSNVAEDYMTPGLNVIVTDICDIEQVNNYSFVERCKEAS